MTGKDLSVTGISNTETMVAINYDQVRENLFIHTNLATYKGTTAGAFQKVFDHNGTYVNVKDVIIADDGNFFMLNVTATAAHIVPYSPLGTIGTDDIITLPTGGTIYNIGKPWF